jgi:hypothetical protein
MELSEYKSYMYLKENEPILIKEVHLPLDSLGWLVIDSMKWVWLFCDNLKTA